MRFLNCPPYSIHHEVDKLTNKQTNKQKQERKKACIMSCMPFGESHAYECISTDTSEIKTHIAGPWKARVSTSTSYLNVIMSGSKHIRKQVNMAHSVTPAAYTMSAIIYSIHFTLWLLFQLIWRNTYGPFWNAVYTHHGGCNGEKEGYREQIRSNRSNKRIKLDCGKWMSYSVGHL